MANAIEIGIARTDITPAVGYTNGSIGYVPTVDAYPEGGYEVTHACQVDPEAGGMINENCLALLRQVMA